MPNGLDPWLRDWREVGAAVQERHTDFAESAQGMATDGERWYVVSNRAVVGAMRKVTAPHTLFGRYRNERRIGVYRLDGHKEREVAPAPDIWAELVRRNRPLGRAHAIHLGDPTWADRSGGCLLVPTQRPSGVWVLSDGLTRQEWWPDPAPQRPELWSWVDRHPENGLLYTSVHWRPDRLVAREWHTLRPVPDADIPLGPGEHSDPALVLDRVQGGAFTDDGTVLLTSSQAGGQVWAHATSDGSSRGVLELGDFHELEGIVVRTCSVAGARADVHLLAADTDYLPFLRWGDSFRVRSYRVPHGS